MEPPKSLNQLRGFVGAVNYYRDMWPHRSRVLAPLTKETGNKTKDGKKKTTFEWTEEMQKQKAFDQMKSRMAIDAISVYPDHNKRFNIYTDASNYQLGACIKQEGRIVAYYSKKLNKSQLNDTTMEQEMMSIVMTLKEFRSMLLGADIHIHTDHKNLTFENLQTQRVLRWRAYLEEYSPTLHYIEGPKNVIADTFSRLHRQDETPVLEGKNVHIAPNVTRRPSLNRKISNNTNKMQDAYYSILEDKELVDCFLALPNEECYLNLPFEEVTENPLNLENMRENNMPMLRY
jgi:hypothetical protein